MRSFNDWYLRYWLSSVPGVAEVATIGGFVKQYQVNVDPNRLLAYKVPLMQVMDAVRNGNNEVGARSLEMTGKEYLIRGRGYIQSLADIQNATPAPIPARSGPSVQAEPPRAWPQATRSAAPAARRSCTPTTPGPPTPRATSTLEPYSTRRTPEARKSRA
jgi:hypothetical protein